MTPGIKIIAEIEGPGAVAEKGDLLAFDAGVEGKVPPDAVLIYELWLTSVQKRSPAAKSRGTRARTARAHRLER